MTFLEEAVSIFESKTTSIENAHVDHFVLGAVNRTRLRLTGEADNCAIDAVVSEGLWLACELTDGFMIEWSFFEGKELVLKEFSYLLQAVLDGEVVKRTFQFGFLKCSELHIGAQKRIVIRDGFSLIRFFTKSKDVMFAPYVLTQ